MFKRMLFSIQEGVKYRAKLKAIPYVEKITAIDWQSMWNKGIRVVVLDFDGVLAADKRQKLEDEVWSVLKNIHAIYGEHVYIFSNQPTPERQAYFVLHFPWIQFLVAKQKPYPDGLLTVIERENVAADSVVLVDDRVLTGGLASVLAGTQCLLIQKPYIHLNGNPLREILFISIRAIERLFFR